MTFSKLISLMYVDRAYFGNQSSFLLNLLKRSVHYPDKIDFQPTTLKGYFQGNPITELTILLLGEDGAEFDKDFLSEYIRSLYEKKHKDSSTYNKKFENKTYKEILYEKVIEVFDDITQDNMSEVLAEKFYDIIKDTYSKVLTLSHNVEKNPMNKVKKRHAEDIERIIKNITTLTYKMIYWYESDVNKDSFQTKYFEYYELNRELAAYGIIYPFIEGLQNLPEYILKEKDFYGFEESTPYLIKYGDYMSFLTNIRKELITFDEE